MMIFLLLCAGIVALVLTEGFFSGSETVFTSASRAFLHDLAAKGDARAIRVRALLASTERFFGTTLMGTNLAVVASTTLCQLLVARFVIETSAFARFAEHVQVPWNWGSLINTVIMTPLILVLGELIPKSLGRAYADPLSLRLIRPLSLAEIVLRPIVWGMVKVSSVFSGLCGARRSDDAYAPRVTRDDLRALAELATEQGLVEEAAGAMLQTVFDLDLRPVSTVMVPLVDVASLPLDATVGDLERLSIETGHARFPVHAERVDDIVGLISLRGLLFRKEAPAGGPIKPDTPIAEFVHRHLAFIPESKPVGELLHELRYRKTPMAAVVDEHGSVVGILTMEDLVEQIVGEIHDERDAPSRSRLTAGGRVYECEGRMDVRELGQQLGVEIPREGFETAAGLVLKIAGHIPAAGDHFSFEGYDIEVLEVVGRRIVALRFRRQAED